MRRRDSVGGLVSRDEAKMAIDKLRGELVRERAYEESQGAVDAMHVVLRLPAVDAAPVVHGEWKWSHGGECSECGFHNSNFDYRYCPMCGAMMDR